MTATVTDIRGAMMQAMLSDAPLAALVAGGEIAHRYTRKVVNIPSTGASITYFDTLGRGGYMPSFTQTIYFDIWSRDADLAEEVADRLQKIFDSYATPPDGGAPTFQPPATINLTAIRAFSEHDDVEPGEPEIHRKSLIYYLSGWDLQS